MAGTIAHILPRTVPLGWAFWMCYTGQFIDAQTAFQIGLTQGLYPAEELMNKAIELAETINANGAPVITGTREFIYKSLDVPLSMAKALEYLYYEHIARSDNYVEGTLAFAEKRRPGFSNNNG
jgi:enoyl-CoA hydratase/carnithine racemase